MEKEYTRKEQIEIIDNLVGFYESLVKFNLGIFSAYTIPTSLFAMGLLFTTLEGIKIFNESKSLNLVNTIFFIFFSICVFYLSRDLYQRKTKIENSKKSLAKLYGLKQRIFLDEGIPSKEFREARQALELLMR